MKDHLDIIAFVCYIGLINDIPQVWIALSYFQVGCRMRSQKDPFPKYPQQLRVSTAHPDARYVRKFGCYAVHGRQPDVPAPGAVLLLNEGDVAIFSGESDETGTVSIAGNLSPVYALHPNGPLAVPTGLIFVRFAQRISVESRREEIHRAGYEVAEDLFYAPHAAWLRILSGDIADALAGIPVLEAMPDVENVEPQMLTERARRQ